MKSRVLLVVAAALIANHAALAQCSFSAAKARSVCGAKGSTCSAPVDVQKVEAEVTTDALAALLRSGVKATILDARTGKWDDGRRIPGAKSLAANATPEQVAAVAGKNKDALIVTYCTNLKCQASKRLATALRGLGYTNVLEYPEGIEGWAGAAKTVAQAR